jgi:hypothetical protein
MTVVTPHDERGRPESAPSMGATLTARFRSPAEGVKSAWKPEQLARLKTV